MGGKRLNEEGQSLPDETSTYFDFTKIMMYLGVVVFFILEALLILIATCPKHTLSRGRSIFVVCWLLSWVMPLIAVILFLAGQVKENTQCKGTIECFWYYHKNFTMQPWVGWYAGVMAYLFLGYPLFVWLFEL